MRNFFSLPKNKFDGVGKGGLVGIIASRCLFPKVKETPTNPYDLNRATVNNVSALALTLACAAVGALWGADNAARTEGRPRPYVAAAALTVCVVIAALSWAYDPDTASNTIPEYRSPGFGQ
jgi:hypothetical protein